MSDERRRTPPEGWPIPPRTVTRELHERLADDVHELERVVGVHRERLANVEIEVAVWRAALDSMGSRLASIEATLGGISLALTAPRTKTSSQRPPTFAETELAEDAKVRRRIVTALGMAAAAGIGALAQYLAR